MTIQHDNLAITLSGSHRDRRTLLQAVVDVARAIFDAQASSIFLLDESERFLVFEAVSGAGSGTLVGRRFPAGEGIAGWVLGSRQPLAIQDLSTSPRFAKAFAESTGYLPGTMLATPLLHADRAVGVLEVLDHEPERTRILGDLDLLALFARQASVAIDLLHRIGVALAGRPHDAQRDALLEIAETLGAADERRREPALRMLMAARDLLVGTGGNGA